MNNSNYTFCFKFETQEKFSKLMQNLNFNKAMQQYHIPTKTLQGNSEISSYILFHKFNNSLFSIVFPSSLKKADITPIYKKDEKFLRNNYRPVSILPSVSKIYKIAMWISKRISKMRNIACQSWLKNVIRFQINGVMLGSY